MKVSDPSISKGEYFIRFEDFIDNYKNEIYKVWILEREGSEGIETDTYIQKIESPIEDSFEGIPTSFSTLLEDNPLFLLNLSNRINRTILNFNGIDKQLLSNQIGSTISDSLESNYCERMIPKNHFDPLKIIQLLRMYFQNSLNDFDQIQINFPEYLHNTTQFNISDEDGQLMGIFNGQTMGFQEAISTMYESVN